MEAELLELTKGVKLLKILVGLHDEIIEGDNFMLMKDRSCKGLAVWRFMAIWEGLLYDLDSIGKWERLSFCQAQANQLADDLAKLMPPYPLIFLQPFPAD